MIQLTIESILPITEGLYCPKCQENTMIMKSRANDYGVLYTHPTECTVCGFFVNPCGVKSFILDHWKESFDNMEAYARLRGFEYEWMKRN